MTCSVICVTEINVEEERKEREEVAKGAKNTSCHRQLYTLRIRMIISQIDNSNE
jgi:hypothetical protein